MKWQLTLSVILVLVTPLAAAAAGHTKGRAVRPFTSEFNPGDYVWHPEVSPAGPVVILVSLSVDVLYGVIKRNRLRNRAHAVSYAIRSGLI